MPADPHDAIRALEAQNKTLLAEVKLLREFAQERHRQWRDAEDVIHTMSYPEADADLLDAVADKINCGDVRGKCEHSWYEADTNADVCNQDDRADDGLGCRFQTACQLRDLAKALRARARQPDRDGGGEASQ